MTTIRVSVQPHVYGGLKGYRVRWFDGKKDRAYFVSSKDAAQDTKARAKQGKKPRCWAVRA